MQVVDPQITTSVNLAGIVQYKGEKIIQYHTCWRPVIDGADGTVESAISMNIVDMKAAPQVVK